VLGHQYLDIGNASTLTCLAQLASGRPITLPTARRGENIEKIVSRTGMPFCQQIDKRKEVNLLFVF